jgi:hypothetical protein
MITGAHKRGREKSSGQAKMFDIWQYEPWTEPQLNLRSTWVVAQKFFEIPASFHISYFASLPSDAQCTNDARNFRNIALKEPLGNTPLRWMYIVYNNTVRGLQHHYLCLEETGLDSLPSETETGGKNRKIFCVATLERNRTHGKLQMGRTRHILRIRKIYPPRTLG